MNHIFGRYIYIKILIYINLIFDRYKFLIFISLIFEQINIKMVIYINRILSIYTKVIININLILSRYIYNSYN